MASYSYQWCKYLYGKVSTMRVDAPSIVLRTRHSVIYSIGGFAPYAMHLPMIVDNAASQTLRRMLAKGWSLLIITNYCLEDASSHWLTITVYKDASSLRDSRVDEVFRSASMSFLALQNEVLTELTEGTGESDFAPRCLQRQVPYTWICRGNEASLRKPLSHRECKR